ncbi:MAG TPA: S26 family signal peptidase [Rhodanobacteraceae bacterium]|nr:S26 family signal peptidase [Rhodanobacteraceae bacterium]
MSTAQSLRRNALRLLALVVAMIGAGLALESRYGVVVDPARVRCLPYRFYVMDKTDSHPVRNGYFAFHTRNLPPFADGTPFIKQMAGMPGDLVEVDGATVRIAGIPWGAINPGVLQRAHLTREQILRHSAIAPGHFLMLGRLPESFDGRYWGDIAADQLVARVYPVW